MGDGGKKARQIAEFNPLAVRASERGDQQLTAGHIAVKNQDWELLHFFETLDNFDFDLPDVDGETPLFKAIPKNHAMVVFLVEKGARLTHTSIKNKWCPVYIAACMGSVETLKYLLSFGLDPNQ